MKIGLFYGSTTCYTEIVAEKIQQLITGLDAIDSQNHQVDVYNIKDTPLSEVADYDYLIFGISTWDFGELQEDWENIWEDIEQIDLNDKIVAIYGLGDQFGYTEWFQDAVGMLHDKAVLQDATMVGYWPNQGYEFEKSLALTEDKSEFMGLALDDESQYELTDQRIADWCPQVLAEMQAVSEI
ncbi:MAG: flavodoxin II [Phenylobacterium sp.]|jgi:flavodoxin II